jgi:phosphoesterase RecJ-like protein
MSSATRVLVIGHVAPDGDSVSSALAIARKENGVLYVHEPHLNPTLAWLVEETGIKVLHDKEAVAWKPEKLIVVDCAPTKLRAGFPIETYLAVNPDVTVRNIDHHADRVGEEPLLFENRVEKIIDPKASSTAEVLINQGFRDDILLVGLATDTGNFEYSHPNQAMSCALALRISDERILYIRDKIRITLDYKQLQEMFGTELRYYYSGHYHVLFGRMRVTNTDIMLRLIELSRGFDFVAITQGNGRASLRTRTNTDLSVFARRFGGGGHARASGCIVGDYDKFVEAYSDFILEL